MPKVGFSHRLDRPISPSPNSHFGNEQSGTCFGKAEPAGVRQRDRHSRIPVAGSFAGMQAAGSGRRRWIASQTNLRHHAVMARTAMFRIPRGIITAAFGAWMLSGCHGGAPTSGSPRKANNDIRQITGVLTFYNEGEAFRECSLQEPWNCYAQRKPECGFAATPEGSRLIKAAVEKAGASQGFATFGVVMTGVLVPRVSSGHLSVYNCEYRARSIMKVYEVPSVPPPN